MNILKSCFLSRFMAIALVLDKEGNVWFTEIGMYFRGRHQNKIGKLVP